MNISAIETFLTVVQIGDLNKAARRLKEIGQCLTLKLSRFVRGGVSFFLMYNGHKCIKFEGKSVVSEGPSGGGEMGKRRVTQSRPSDRVKKGQPDSPTARQPD